MSRFTGLRPSPAMLVACAALFVALGGVGYAAATIGSAQIKDNSVRSGDLRNNDVRTQDLRNNDVRTQDIRNGTLLGNDVRNNTLSGNQILESSLGKVPSASNADNATNAGNASKLEGNSSAAFVKKTELMWALVDYTGALTAGSGATAATRLGPGSFRVTFNRPVDQCISQGGSTDDGGGAVPAGSIAMIVATDNRVQADTSTVDVSTTNPAGTQTDPNSFDGFTVTVYC